MRARDELLGKALNIVCALTSNAPPPVIKQAITGGNLLHDLHCGVIPATAKLFDHVSLAHG